MSQDHFSIKFVGDAVDSGEIDVRDLAPALLAVGDLFQASSRRLNGEHIQTSVKVRATDHGSFEVDLAITQTAKDKLAEIFDFATENQDGIVAASDLVDLLLKAGTLAGSAIAGTAGLLALIKFLRNRKPDEITENEDGTVTVIVGDTKIITNKRVIQLAEDVKVRESAQKLAAAASAEGMERIEFIDGENFSSITIEATETELFTVPETEDEILEEESKKRTLQLISVSFKDGNKWKFTDGGDEFFAEVEDVDFLNKVSNDEIAFSKNDYLICIVREKQTIGSKGLKRERVIERVLNHSSAARQLKLI